MSKNLHFVKEKYIAANKQLLDEVFVISRIIKVEVSVVSQLEPKVETDNTYRDLDYFSQLPRP